MTHLLLKQGYQQSTSDYSLFTLKHKPIFTALLVYVDDIIIVGNSLTGFSNIKAILDQNFKIKDLGILKYFLGLEVDHSKDGIFISQRKYYLNLLESSGLLRSKPASTPLDPSSKLNQDNNQSLEDISAYIGIIGKLLYLNTT